MGYLTINPFIDDGFFDVDYLNKQEAIYEDKYLRHITFKKELTVVIDGENNKAAIFKEGILLENTVSNIEESIEELPPEGFM